MTKSPIGRIEDALSRISLRAHNQIFKQLHDDLGDHDRMRMIQHDCNAIRNELKNLTERSMNLSGVEATDEKKTD